MACNIKKVDFGLLVVSILSYLYFYLNNPFHADLIAQKIGWYGWIDQGLYLKSLTGFESVDLSSENHWYPIGYSLFATAFSWIFPKDPFLPLNLVSFAIFFIFFQELGKRYLNAYVTFAIFWAALLLPTSVKFDPYELDFPILTQFIFPWNTNPVSAAYSLILFVICGCSRPISKNYSFLVGLILGFITFTRPIDILALLAPLIITLIQQLKYHHLISCLKFSALGMGLISIPLAALTYSIHSTFLSKYVLWSGKVGFEFSTIAERFYTIFLNAQPIYQTSENPLFTLMPWLAGIIPLFLLWGILSFRQGGKLVLCVLMSWVIYLSYNELFPTNIFRFNGIHYLSWSFPYLFLGGCCALLDIFKSKLKALCYLGGGLAFLYLISSLHMDYQDLPEFATTNSKATDVLCPNDYKLFAINIEGNASALKLSNLSLQNTLNYDTEEIPIYLGEKELSRFKDYRLIRKNDDLYISFSKNMPLNDAYICIDIHKYGSMDIKIQPKQLKFYLN